VIHWERDRETRACELLGSADGSTWNPLWSAREASGPRTYVYLPGGARSRHLRLQLAPASGGAHGIRALDVQPFEFSRSLADFFHAVAAAERRGLHPRWLHREQSYWTPVGVDGGTTPAILNEEGLLEPDRGSFSLEPFLFADGQLVTWADAEISQSLAHGCLPLPTSTWRHGELRLSVSAYETGGAPGATAHARYRVENQGAKARRVRLFAALRPFQVTPPWQAFKGLGGPSAIHALEWLGGVVSVNGRWRVAALPRPSGFGAAAFEQGGVLLDLERGELPSRSYVADSFGAASGALAWDLELAPGASQEVELAVPSLDRAEGYRAAEPSGIGTLEAVTSDWAHKLGRVQLRLPALAAPALDAVRTATAHVLVCRDGPALQPGPRRYLRSWIRDGATMAAALLRMGFADEVRDFLRWYAPYQAPDGNVPCAVDRSGPDWLPEHDSHGQLAFCAAEHYRLTGDLDLARELWPAVLQATRYLESLRERRCTPEFRTPEKRACYGILPESASHEGYLAHPVHAYWDDFWALRGLADARLLAEAVGDSGAAERLAKLHDALHQSVYASIEITIAERRLQYVPGSVEWADFDPAATANGIAITDAAQRLPADALAWTFDEYLRGLRRRRSGELDWNNYTAYEIRILAALVRLGRRADADEVLGFFLGDRRPRAWNQWPEISWRDPRSPGHLGDVPHAWIGAEYVLAVLGMLAYERPVDDALVLAAGIPGSWLDAGEISVQGLPTAWGPLGYRLRRSGHALELELAPGLRVPPGGIAMRPPLSGPIASAAVDGAPARELSADGVTLRHCPARVVLTLRR
jgi:hypothetical protein